jgi:hypothetical protein
MIGRLSGLLVLLIIPAIAYCAGNDAPQPLPVSAHNCYPENSTSNDRLVEALGLGIDNIEIDLGWDEAGGRLIVGHDAAPRPGIAYPELEPYLVPALEAHWRKPRPDGAPRVLTIDWKTDHPAAVRRFKQFLDTHPDWFTSAPKAAASPLAPRRLTVCLSGSDRAKDLYDESVPAGGEYRAFRDTVFGAGGGYREEVATYAPAAATAYHRFLAFHWGHIERGGPARAVYWTDEEAARLKALVEHVHGQGFRVRFYTLNGHTGPLGGPYRFIDDAAAEIRWMAAAGAGADWVASDEYEAIVRTLSAPAVGDRNEEPLEFIQAAIANRGPSKYFNNPVTAASFFLAAVGRKDLNAIAQATALRAAIESKNTRLFQLILAQKLGQEDLDELARELSGYQVRGITPGGNTVKIVVTRPAGNGVMRRTLTMRHEKAGWKVQDISGEGELAKPILVPRAGRAGNRQ